MDNLDGEVGFSVVRIKDDNVDVKLINPSIGGTISRTGVGVRAGIDLISGENQFIKGRLGVNIDTGVTVNNGSLNTKLFG